MQESAPRMGTKYGVMSNHNNHNGNTPPILLTIAGFDPSCGAGIAADLKTFAAHGCYGVAAITSITVQSTKACKLCTTRLAPELREQLEVLAKDCEIAAVKIGMLGNRGNAVVVAEFLDTLQVRARGARSGHEIVERCRTARRRRNQVSRHRTS